MKMKHSRKQLGLLVYRLVIVFTIISLLGGAWPLNQAEPGPGVTPVSAASANEWTQDGHDAQRTGFTLDEVPQPWSLAWTWNGPDANGTAGNHFYDVPPDARTVTGGNFVFVPAGDAGLFALNKSNGSQAWRVTHTSFNASPAYDPATGSLLAAGGNGVLYKLDGNTGQVQGQYNAGNAINKAVLLVGGSAFVTTDNGELHRVNTASMSGAWRYPAGAATATAAAYSPGAGVLVYATEDLYVHAVREGDGSQQWRVKPTSRQPGYPITFNGFWPVIAERHGIVFVRLNLSIGALWSGPNQGTNGGGVYPLTNAETRAHLLANNGALENLFALDLSNGSKKFIPAVGYGATELRTGADDQTGLFLVAPPVPVIKVNSDGSEVAYIGFRSGQGNVPDGRWDSHMGEMVLDDNTIPGLVAGDLRFVDSPNTYVNITDEQVPFTMSGNTIFHAHWGASDGFRILDRSAGRGLTHDNPIRAQTIPAVIRRQQACSDFNPSTHYTTCGLTLFGDGRYWNGPGFWTYWNMVDPPMTAPGGYNLALEPRYTYASDGLIIVEGNGGELVVLRSASGNPAPTATPRPSATATRAVTSTPAQPTATRSPTNPPAQPPAPRTPTNPPAQPTATRTPTNPPAQPTATRTPTNPPAQPTATRTPTSVPTLPPPTGDSLTMDSYQDFAQTCAITSNSHISDNSGGIVELGAQVVDEFAKTTFNTTMWNSAAVTGGAYKPTLGGGLLTLAPNGSVRSRTTFTRGNLEVVAQFENVSGQFLGFVGNLTEANQYFFFTTLAGDGNLYALVNNAGTDQLANLGAIPTGMHRYRIEWAAESTTSDSLKFFIDGAQVAQMSVNNAGASKWTLYMANGSTSNFLVEKAQVSPLYVTSGTYVSCILDAGEGRTWRTITFNLNKPTYTGYTLRTRTSTNGKTWQAWRTLPTSGVVSSPYRYLQFNLTLRTSNTKVTPWLNSISLFKSAYVAPTPTRTPTVTRTPTATRTPTITRTPTRTQTPTKTRTPTVTRTPTKTATRANTAVPTATATRANTAVPTATATRANTAVPTATATRANTAVPTATATRANTATPTQPAATATPTRQVSPTATLPPGSGRISNLKVISGSPAVYEKFEAQFSVQTSATALDMPYDPNPPAGLQSGAGITVNALFSSDNWQTTITQPAFVYQPYTASVVDGKDHMTPAGGPAWAVRFAPQKAGAWQYRLSVQDGQGTSLYPAANQPALTFTAGAASSNAYTRRGFLGVSPADRRYFQFSDGSPFTGVGFNDGYSSTSSTSVEQRMVRYEQNKMNFMRVWLSGSGINGSQWPAWATNFLPNDAYLPGVNFDTANTYNGGLVSMRLDDSGPCVYADFWRGGVPVEPNTTYTLTARVKTSNITGPVSSGDYGFVVKQGGWLERTCVNAGTGKRIAGPVNGSKDWTVITGTYTSGSSEKWLGNLYLARENATGGQVYIDEVHLYRADDPNKVDLLRQPYANSTEHFDTMSASQWDLYIQSAEKHGVYLKLVVDEKNEWIRNHMGADGKISASGDNNNFYGAPGTKSRWLQQAWWRYLIARWGYSTAIHSFEYINEGDPYNGNHYDAAGAMATYFKQNDPSRHMVTTSFWHSFPNNEFWSNPKYADIAYTDVHAYTSTGWGEDASFIPSSMKESQAANVRTGKGSARVAGNTQSSTSIVPRGTVIQGQGEWIIQYWMKASGLTANCSYSSTGSSLRVRWMLDNGNYGGGKEGVVPANSEAKDFICTSPSGTFDWRQFKSTSDRDGNALPTTARIILTDNNPHALNLLIENSGGTGGTAWIDDVQLISPNGQVQPVIGTFETTSLREDTAWSNIAYGQVFGGNSLVGGKKPIVRGETGLDNGDTSSYDSTITRDTQGIWLHNNVWAQTSAGGMYDLFWWASETIPQNFYSHYLTYQNFMAGIPLTNGRYRDSLASASNEGLRVSGQRDDTAGQMHLWIQNVQHTWRNVVNGASIPSLSGTISIPNVSAGSYRVEWWNTYATSSPVFKTETVSANGSLVLTLPSALSDDVAVKISRVN